MAVKFANLASTTLSSAITNSATSIAVADASLFPTLGSGDYFYATIGEGGGSEIVKVTAISSNTLTVTRAQDGTTASAFSSGETIALRVVAAALDDIASQAQSAADTESVSIDGDTMTGGLILESTLLSRGHSSGDNWMPYTDGNFYIRAPLTIFDNNVRFADGSGILEFSGDNSGNHYLNANSGQIRIRPNGTTTNKIVLDSSYINAPAYQVGGTTVIDSSRNATFTNVDVTGSFTDSAVNRGIKFDSTSMKPSNGSGGDADNHVDLGTSSARFKNLYLSGTITSGAITTSGHIQQNYGYELRGKDSDGTVRTLLRTNSDKLQIGWSYAGDVEFMGGGSYTKRMAISGSTGDVSIVNDLNVSGDLNIASVLAHSGDLDTYFQFNAANTARIVVGGSQKFVVNTNGVSINNGTLNMTSNNITNAGTISSGTHLISDSGSATPSLDINRNLDGGRIRFRYSGSTTTFGEIGMVHNGSTGDGRLWIGMNLNSFGTSHSTPTQGNSGHSSWYQEISSHDDYIRFLRISAGGTSGTEKFRINSSGVQVTGNIGGTSGHVSGKFAVKSTSVHASYDFYNNGTTYLNGATIIDDALNLTGSNAKLQIGSTTVIDSNRQFLVGSHIYFGGATNQSFIRQQNTNLEFFGDGNLSFRTYNSGWYERLQVNDSGITVTGSISGALASSVTATTQNASDNSTKVATTAYVDSAVSGLVGSAPSALDTLNELASALGNDANFSTTVTDSIATKLPKAGGTMTGNLTISRTVPVIVLNDSDATNTTNQIGYVSFQRQGTESGYVGYGSSGNSNVYLSGANSVMIRSGGTDTIVATNTGATVSGTLSSGAINSSGSISTSSGSVSATGSIGNLVSGSQGQQMERGNDAVTTLRFDANRWRLYAGANAGEMFTAKENGNVGINNADPLQKLSVNGVINSDSDNDYYGAWLQGNSATGGYSNIGVGEWYSVGLYLQKKQGQNFSHIYNYNASHPIAIAAGSSSNGETAGGSNVGVGLTNPSVKFHVLKTGTEQSRFAYDANNYTAVNYDGLNTVGGNMLFKIGGTERARLGNSLLQLASSNTGKQASLDISGNEGRLRISNGSNWGLIMRGITNAPRIGAWTGGTIAFWAANDNVLNSVDTTKGESGEMFTIDNANDKVISRTDLHVEYGKLVVKSSSNGFAKIEGTDANHMIIMRGNRDSTTTGTDMTTYYQYGGTRANGKGHLFYTGGALASQTLKLGIYDDAIEASQPLFLTNGNIHSNNTFQFLTNGSAAQNIRTKSVFAGTAYGDTPPAGSFNATNTYELNGTTVIDSSRNLNNIGSATIAGDVTIGGSSDANRFLIINKATSGQNGIIFKNGGSNKVKILQDSSEHLRFYTNNTGLRMSILENGNVGVGIDAPTYRLHVYNANNDAPMMIDSGSANGAHLRFASSGTAKHFVGCGGGMGLGDHEDLGIRGLDNIIFSTGGSANERMRLAQNGDWVVSNTNPRVVSQFTNQAGLGWYDADLHAEIATTSNRSALEIGRNNATATGDFVVFRKQATVIGSLGVEGGDSFYIQSDGSTGGGLRFHQNGRISPVRNSSLVNNVIDLGAATQQFANLYLGSGLYMSGSQVVDSSRNLTNIGSVTASGTFNGQTIEDNQGLGGMGFGYKSNSMSRPVGTGVQWIKVASFSGGVRGITMRVVAGGDNTNATDIFFISCASYGFKANIMKFPSTKYNISKLQEVRTKHVSGATYEIWIKLNSITSSAGSVQVSMNDSGVVGTLSAGTEPTVGSNDATLPVSATDRNDYAIQTTNKISTEGGFAVGSTTRINNVGDGLFTSLYIGSTNIVDTSRNLTNIGTISSGAITTNADMTLSGNGTEINFTGGNNRIKFSGYRALEGSTDGVNLQIGEGYTIAKMQADVQLDTGKHLTRSNHHSGHLEGSYNNIGNNASKSNPIYTIGSSYNPNDDTLNNMYGIGYARRDSASYLSSFGGTHWGMYVAADGDARIFLNASSGVLAGTGGYAVGSTTIVDSARDIQNVQAETGTTGLRFKTGAWFYDSSNNARFQFVASSHNYYKTDGNAGKHFFFDGNSTTEATADAFIDASGNGHFAGNVTAYSSSVSSDARLKENIRPIESATETVKQLNGVVFDWKKTERGTDQLGFIAQEIEQVLPSLVTEVETLKDENTETHKTVNYAALVPVLVESIKELTKRIEELENGNN